MNQNFDYTPQNDQSSFGQYGSEQSPTPKGHAKGQAAASLCLGIAAVFFTCCCFCLYYLAIVLSIISIVMAFLSRRDNGGRMSGMAIAGLILAIIGILCFLCCLVVELSIFSLSESELYEMIDQSFRENYGVSFEEYLEQMQNMPAE